MKEYKRRSVAKAFSWRATATITTMVISFFLTGNIDIAIKIGFLEFISKIGLYYGHERLWANIKFGQKPMEYQI